MAAVLPSWMHTLLLRLNYREMTWLSGFAEGLKEDAARSWYPSMLQRLVAATAVFDAVTDWIIQTGWKPDWKAAAREISRVSSEYPFRHDALKGGNNTMANTKKSTKKSKKTIKSTTKTTR